MCYTESTVEKGDLFKDYYNFTDSEAACSFYAVASRAVTFWSHLLEQIHQSRPLGPVVIKRNGEGQDTLALPASTLLLACKKRRANEIRD